MIFGAVIDESLGDFVRITVIATGFERHVPTRRQILEQQYGRQTTQPRQVPARPVARKPEPVTVRPTESEPDKSKFSPSNLDIPAFLRRR